MEMSASPVFVVIPNFNGAADLPVAVDAVLGQSHKHLALVIVDNGSDDGSVALIKRYQEQDSRVRAIFRDQNYGYTGGMNPGLEMAIAEGAEFVAGCNNDARPDKDWLKHMVTFLSKHPKYGSAACKLLHFDGKTIDSTADQYSVWGLAYPRGRDEPAAKTYDKDTEIFGASGGASLYRVKMLKQVGLFDHDFFAYYEDVDLSFRSQLAGWKIRYVPAAVVYHHEGKTAKRLVSGFTTYQYMKNMPMVLVKNVPGSLLVHVLPRFMLAYSLAMANAMFKNHRGGSALRGFGRGLVLLPKKLVERHHIQKTRKVSPNYIWSILMHDLPPNAHKLRKLRDLWWRLTGRHA